MESSGQLEPVREEKLEVFAISGGQGCSGHDGSGGDHGVHAQMALAAGRVEEARCFARLFLGKGDHLGEKSTHDFFLLRRDRAAKEFIPRRHRCQEALAAPIPRGDAFGFLRAGFKAQANRWIAETYEGRKNWRASS